MKLWLDDVRPAPQGWKHCRSVNEAIAFMSAHDHEVEFASLDYSLGIWSSEGGSGLELVHWMASNKHWPLSGLRVHSDHYLGTNLMFEVIDQFSPFAIPTTPDNIRGDAFPGDWPEAKY